VRRYREAGGTLRQNASVPLRGGRRALRRVAHARGGRERGRGAKPLRASRAVGLLRCALPRAVPRARRFRRHVRSIGLYRAHWCRSLGNAAARPRHREPGVRHCAGSRRVACERPPYLRAQHDRRPVGPGPGGAPRRRRGVARRNRHRASARGARVAARRCEQETELILETAKSTLLAPFELESGKLERVFGTLAARKVDYADLYFQHSRFEGWSLEEGIVKSGSFNIEQGVGVRGEYEGGWVGGAAGGMAAEVGRWYACRCR